MRKMIEISRRLQSNEEGAAMTLVGTDLNTIFGKVADKLAIAAS